MDTNARATVWRRTAEVFRVFAICLFVAAFNIFPSGRRNARRVPVEVTVLGAAFVERALTSYVPGAAAVPIGIGSVLLVIVATLVLLSKLRVFSFRRARRAAA
jgi:lipopolysaccharide export system permease protein